MTGGGEAEDATKRDAEPKLRELLLFSALELVAEEGLERVSLRSTATRAGASTAAIVHHFCNKPGLLAAVTRLALLREQEWHAEINGIVLKQRVSRETLIEWVAWYITQRAKDTVAIFWSELLFKARMVAESKRAIAEWREMRCQFWQKVAAIQGFDTEFASFFVAYLSMEEVCAQGLTGQVEYELLMRESIATITAPQYGRDSVIDESVNLILDEHGKMFVIPVAGNTDSPSDKLLDFAKKDILERGTYAITQRKIGKAAGSSGSMIIYYFGSMAEFERQAIWRTMTQGGVPPATNPNSDSSLTDTLEKWAAVMAITISTRRGTVGPGFYCNFARIMGEVSLLSRRRPDMKVLISHLRVLDGSASYAASQTIWRDAFTLSRNQAATFAMWLKGYAVLSNVLEFSTETLEHELKAMVNFITQFTPAPHNAREMTRSVR